MLDDDEFRRLVMLLIWGGGTVVAYGTVFVHRLRSWHLHRDARSTRELVSAFGLLLTSLGAALAIGVVLLGPPGSDIRGWFVALALGAFFAAGIVMASETKSDLDS
jgi:hypothetical protein